MSDYTFATATVFPFGLREIRVKVGSVNKALTAAQSFELTETLTSAELMGDDVVQAVHSFPIKADWKIGNGGIALAGLALITGRTNSSAGLTTTRSITFSAANGDVFPYFTMYVRAVDDSGGDVWYVIYKCKINTGFTGSFAGGAFRTTGLSGIAIPDSGNSNKIYDLASHETAVGLPTS